LIDPNRVPRPVAPAAAYAPPSEAAPASPSPPAAAQVEVRPWG
jgi:hypothetical protein